MTNFAKIAFGAMGSEVERQKKAMLEAGVTGRPVGFRGRAPRPLGRAEALGAFYSEVNTYLGEANKQTTRAGFEDGAKFVTALSMAIQHIWGKHVQRGDLSGECQAYSIEVRERMDAYDLGADDDMHVAGQQVTIKAQDFPDHAAVTTDQLATAINGQLGGVVAKPTNCGITIQSKRGPIDTVIIDDVEDAPGYEAVIHWR